MKEKRLHSCHDGMSANDRQFNGIDAVKLICAYLVCMIHIRPFDTQALGISAFDDVNFYIQQYLCRIAVPFYFAAAGFLLFRKTELGRDIDTGRIKNYCFRLLRLLGTWTLLLFAGLKTHLWYLGALTVAVIILSLLLKTGLRLRYIAPLATAAYAVGLLGNSYSRLLAPLRENAAAGGIINGYETLFGTTRNGLFFGLIFVLMGGLLARKRIVISLPAAAFGFAASMAVMLAEVYLLRRYFEAESYDMLVSLLPAAFFLLYIAVNVKLKDSAAYKRMRAVGMLVFFSHRLVVHFIGLAFTKVKNSVGVNLYGFQFLAAVIITTALAAAVVKLSEKERFGFLKYLYS